MNFCFVINDLLSASSQPGKNRRTKYYLDLYRENNIKALISLYKKIDIPAEYESYFQTYHFKYNELVQDIHEFDQVVDVIINHMRKKEAVNVNCEGGISESAVLLTAVLMKHCEMSYHEAFQQVAEHRYAMEDDESLSQLMNYEKFLKSQSRNTA